MNLLTAAALPDIEWLESLLFNGANPNGRGGKIRFFTRGGCEKEGRAAPLLVASRIGHFDAVRLLLRYGAATDVTTDDGQTPLLIATSYGYMDIVKILLSHGADPNAVSEVLATSKIPPCMCCRMGARHCTGQLKVKMNVC